MNKPHFIPAKKTDMIGRNIAGRLIIVPNGGHCEGMEIEKYTDEIVSFFDSQRKKN